jgi:dTDP-glucose 4,6-dehydratase
MNSHGKTVLITGGAGFIGSNFVHHLWKKYPDYRLVVLDLLTYAGSPENMPSDPNDRKNGRFEFWFGDVCNAELVDTLVSKSDMVVHFAAESHVTRSIYDNYAFYRTDVLGTHSVANAVLKYRDRIERFIHISTSEVYGTAEQEKMGEEHPLKPLSPYASAKCGADRLVWSYGATYGIPAVIIRPFNNYGPRQHLEKVVPRFITSVLLDEPLTVHGDGGAARDFVHVEDNCRAIDLALHADIGLVGGKIYNVGSEQHRSVGSIANDVIRLMGSGSTISVMERPGQVFRHTADSSLICRELGWRPSLDWETGMQSTIEWYRRNRSWWEKQIWMRHIPIRLANGDRTFH